MNMLASRHPSRSHRGPPNYPPPVSTRPSRRPQDGQAPSNYNPLRPTLQHTSSNNHLPGLQSEDEEPIYDVPPVEWTQTLPSRGASRRRITDPGDASVAIAAAASLNNRPLTLHLGNSQNSTCTLSSQSTYNASMMSSTNTVTGYDEYGSVKTLTRDRSPQGSPPDQSDSSLEKSHKRSKSKTRSFVKRSGSVVKSIFSNKSKKDNAYPNEHQPPQMQGRLFHKCLKDIDTSLETVPWKQVSLSTVYNKLHAIVDNDNEIVFDLYGSKCEPMQLKGQKKRSIFKLSLQGESSIRIFQADTKEAMMQWIDCIEALSSLTPMSNGTGSQGSPNSTGLDFLLPLEAHVPSGINRHIPLIVQLCAAKVEALGMQTVGIYRVPGNSILVLTLLTEITQLGFDFNLQDERLNDVHNTASVLKTFFRKLPDPLINDDWYTSLIVANRKKEPQERLDQMKRILHELPPHNFETLKFLAAHLQRISNYCNVNKMDITNLSIVFGPTLLRTNDGDMVAMWTDMVDQRCIIEVIISHNNWLFSPLLDDFLPDVVRSADSNTSLSQIHKNTTAPVRKMSADLTTAALSRTSSRESHVSPRHEVRSNTLSPSYSPSTSAQSHSASSEQFSPKLSGRVSPSAPRNFNPGKKIGIPCIPGAKSPSSTTQQSCIDAPQSNILPIDTGININSSDVGAVECTSGWKDSVPDMIEMEDNSSRERMLAELDNLIESLKPDEKCVENQRRSKEEGEQLFSEFCEILPENKEEDSLDLIMLELDEKIASLRTEYTFKVDSLSTVNLETVTDVTNQKFSTAECSTIAMISKATYIENKAFGLVNQSESMSSISSCSGSCDLRSEKSDSNNAATDQHVPTKSSNVHHSQFNQNPPKFSSYSINSSEASSSTTASSKTSLSQQNSSKSSLSYGFSKESAPAMPSRSAKPPLSARPINGMIPVDDDNLNLELRNSSGAVQQREPSFYENMDKNELDVQSLRSQMSPKTTLASNRSEFPKTLKDNAIASPRSMLNFSFKSKPAPLPPSNPPPLKKKPEVNLLPSKTRHTNVKTLHMSGEDLLNVRQRAAGSGRDSRSEVTPPTSPSAEATGVSSPPKSNWVTRSNPDLLHDRSLQFNSSTFFQSQV